MKDALIVTNIIALACIAIAILTFAAMGVDAAVSSDIRLDRDSWTCTQSGIMEVHHPKRSQTFDRLCTQWTMAPMEKN
jgi:hypothetical protein